MMTLKLYKQILLSLLIFFIGVGANLLAQGNTKMARVKHVADGNGTGDPRFCFQQDDLNCGTTYFMVENFTVVPNTSSVYIDNISVSVSTPIGPAQVSNIRLQMVDPIIAQNPVQGNYQVVNMNMPAYIGPSWFSNTGKIYFNVVFDIEFCQGWEYDNIPLGQYYFDISVYGRSLGSEGGDSDETYDETSSDEEIPGSNTHTDQFIWNNQYMVESLLYCDETSLPHYYSSERSGENGVSGTMNTLTAHLYPNPSSSTSLIDLTLATGSALNVHIFDMNGRKVITSKKIPYLDPGNHQIKLATQNLVPGIYVIEIQTETEKQTLKLLKTK